MNKTFVELINAGLRKAMQIDATVLCYGLNINDSGRIFGSTVGLLEDFGGDRVFDMPTAENAMTGVGIGLAIQGFRPILNHYRLDFTLLSLDQIINGAAKWHSLFAGTMPVPMTIRMIVGRGWGQGPTHCQSLQACFAHIPGLKVVMPGLAEDVYGLLLSSIFDNNPVIFIEHRWLHHICAGSSADLYRYIPLGKANVVVGGDDITIVSMSYITVEALHAVKFLSAQGVSCELIDLRTVKPLDWNTIYHSIKKTGKLLVLDTGFEFCSIAAEVIAKVSMDCFDDLRCPPKRLVMPDYPVLTSPALAVPMYTYSDDIVRTLSDMLRVDIDIQPLTAERDQCPRDIPGRWFNGPF